MRKFIFGVITSLTGSLILELFTSIKPWTLLWKLVQSLISFLGYPITLPVWALILVALALPIIAIAVRATLLSEEPQPTEPRRTNYVSDTILDIKWGWTWYGQEITNLTALCPKCLNELTESTESHPTGNLVSLDPRTYICDHCGFGRNFEITTSQVKNKVKREIRRKLRTGEFITS